ncbi:hypothetical protein G4B88_028799 [Cannabis sativa]|uniref:Uncharacterized protein n=1 Tax=Cannabis sativa TaxID=3483 RepID=A0A7J6FQ35_CANSA|nr:hypothetical protein G4B88_028799 [Cannabis sativa]
MSDFFSMVTWSWTHGPALFFGVLCLHVPVYDRTPFEDNVPLIMLPLQRKPLTWLETSFGDAYLLMLLLEILIKY